MKSSIACCAVFVLTSLIGCNSGHDELGESSHDRIGDAPRRESATSVAGWKAVATSGISIQLPADWKMMDLAAKDFEKNAKTAFGNDPKSEALRNQAVAMAKQGMIKLFAFDPATLSKAFQTNCSITMQDTKTVLTLERIVAATVQQEAPVLVAGTQPKVEYLALESGRTALIRSEIKTPRPSTNNLVSLAYVNLKGSKVTAIMFTTTDADEQRIRKIADHSITTFRYTK